jgi:hypothetical protein
MYKFLVRCFSQTTKPVKPGTYKYVNNILTYVNNQNKKMVNKNRMTSMISKHNLSESHSCKPFIVYHNFEVKED